MLIVGRVFKEKGERLWGAECESLVVHTQGATRKDAMLMLKDAIELLADTAKINLKVDVTHGTGDSVYIGSKDTKAMVAFLLRRQRQIGGCTIMKAAERMGSRSPTAYARYEEGKSEPSLSKLYELILAINPKGAPAFLVDNSTAGRSAKGRDNTGRRLTRI